MTTDPRPWDVTELDAGDVRRLSDTSRTGPYDLQVIRPITYVEFAPSGDLDDAARRLGVDVADLVKLRRKLGVAPSHRRPSVLHRLFRKG